MDSLAKAKLALFKTLEEIYMLDLPCYAAVDATGFDTCDEEHLCDACKTIQLAHDALKAEGAPVTD